MRHTQPHVLEDVVSVAHHHGATLVEQFITLVACIAIIKSVVHRT